MDVEGARRGDLSACEFRVGAHVVDPRANTIAGPSGSQSVEPKVMDVLLELCARQGEVVSREALIDAVWGVHHGADESLTRAISLLRKALEAGPQGRRAIETFSKRGYRLNLEVSPIETDEPERVAATSRANGGGAGGIWRFSRTWGLGAAAMVVAGVALWTATSGYEDPTPEGWSATDEGVRAGQYAIEPWAGRPGVGDFTQTGPRALASAFAERGIPSVLIDNGRATSAGLASEFHISGEVRQRSESLAVDITVVDREGAVVWAKEQSRREVEGLSLVEGAVAHAANVAECAMTARRQSAAEMTSFGLALWMRYCDGVWANDYAATMEAGERLVDVFPDEPGAYAAVAKIATHIAMDKDREEETLWRERADAAALRALELDEENLDALAIRAVVHPGDWDAAAAALKALERSEPFERTSNEDLHYYLLRQVGFLDQALLQAALMSARIPGPVHLSEEAWLMATAGLKTRALAQMDEVIRLYPSYHDVYWRRFNVLALHGNELEAEIALQQAQTGIYPDKTEEPMPCWERYLQARLGRIEAEGALTEEACSDLIHGFRARLHAALGQVDEALEYSQRALIGDDYNSLRGNTIHLFYPEMAEVRRDARFWRMVDDIGLVDFWRGYGRWPDFCSDRRTPVDCEAMAEEAIAGRT